jgi:hypothetical protein
LEIRAVKEDPFKGKNVPEIVTVAGDEDDTGNGILLL